MFIWDFVADTVLGQIVDWIYGQMIGFLGNFFSLMGQMGAELFELDWIQAIVLFFSQLAWVLYVVGLVVAVFECAIEYQSGRGSVRDTALNALKGFMAARESLLEESPGWVVISVPWQGTSLTAWRIRVPCRMQWSAGYSEESIRLQIRS